MVRTLGSGSSPGHMNKLKIVNKKAAQSLQPKVPWKSGEKKIVFGL
jgi:hypothetical protein